MTTLTVALVSEVFWQPDGEVRLTDRLNEAADKGAELALLPEIPMNPSRQATKGAVDDDAEEEGGRRPQMMAGAASATGVAMVGGIIRRDPRTGRRTSRALLFDGRGDIVGRYEKLHLPEEPGFWETSHYEPGLEPGRLLRLDDVPLGVQICSDSNRPQMTHVLAAEGALAILAPRATERDTWESWKLVYRANALTS